MLLEAVEEVGEQRLAVDGAAGRLAGGDGDVLEPGRRPVPVDVEAHTHHHSVHRVAFELGLGQEAAQLAVADNDVVGPLQQGPEAGDLVARIGRGDGGRHGRAVHVGG